MNQNGLAVGMDHTHAIMIPKTALFGSQPMNDAEMQQLIRELHDAIIVEGTLPFFSLHFNAQHGYTDALYPIIPPQYENTIAGKTLLDLDYAMKERDIDNRSMLALVPETIQWYNHGVA